MKVFLIVIVSIILGVALGVGIAMGLDRVIERMRTPVQLGSSSDNVLPLLPTATKVFVNSSDTLVVASSSGRQYLEIQNASGATTTAQAVSCNFGDRPATLYTGLTIFASTSKAFNLDNLYRGAIHCIAPANGALVSVTDF